MFQGPKGYIAQICKVPLQYGKTKSPYYVTRTPANGSMQTETRHHYGHVSLSVSLDQYTALMVEVLVTYFGLISNFINYIRW